MSDETSFTVCSVASLITAAFAIFCITSCVKELDRTGEARRSAAQQQEHELNIARTKAGLQYIPQGTWLKVSPIEKEETK